MATAANGSGAAAAAILIPKAILILGVGPGISTSVAKRFGKEGYTVGLASLALADAQKAKGVLDKMKITSFAFEFEASDPASVAACVVAAKQAMGRISVLHYNAYAMHGGKIIGGDPTGIARCCGVTCTGLVAAVQQLHGDLKRSKGAILVTSSGAAATGVPDGVDKFLSGIGATGYFVSKCAQHKLIALLHHTLKPDGIFVGKVNVNAIVKNTAWDDGTAKIHPDTVGEAIWQLLVARKDCVGNVENPVEVAKSGPATLS